MRGGRRKKTRTEPLKHVRLELIQSEHEILKTLAQYRGMKTLGYVRWLVRREIRRFKNGNECRR
jgi:predicted HTH domain antitoxin